MALFLYGSNAPGGPWAVVGAGIRAALEVGAHRKRMYSPTLNVEEELWRRAFWYVLQAVHEPASLSLWTCALGSWYCWSGCWAMASADRAPFTTKSEPLSSKAHRVADLFPVSTSPFRQSATMHIG